MAKKILFLVTEDWFFCSHRLLLAKAAKKAGYEVVVATRVRHHAEKITSCGIRLIPLEFSRHSLNPFRELVFIRRIIQIYKQEKPDIVHHVANKPILFGSLAAFVASVPHTVNALTGLRYNVFFASDWKTRLICPLAKLCFTLSLNKKNSVLILQNHADKDFLIKSKMLKPGHEVMIRGAGVDIRQFSYADEVIGPLRVVLASRMLWDKGVGEFVEAVRMLKKIYPQVCFVLAGDSDTGNPAAIPEEQLEAWQKEGVVEWWGHREDMPFVFSQAHIVVLPSYREGLPKVLLEAAASGKPIVTTDTSGCREVVRDNVNGFLVPVKDAEGLAEAISKLIKDESLRKNMGRASRRIAEQEFSSDQVIGQTLNVYQELVHEI